MVADEVKENDFGRKIDKDIFKEIKADTHFVSYKEIFEIYKNAVILRAE